MDRKQQQQSRPPFPTGKSSLTHSYGHEGRTIPRLDTSSHYGRVESMTSQSSSANDASSNRSGGDVPFFTSSKVVVPSQSIKSTESFRPSTSSQHSQQVSFTTNPPPSMVQDWRLTTHQSKRNQVINSM
jgi:hypothetical protein